MTPEQQKQFEGLIGKVVLANATLPYSNRLGTGNFTTIQEVIGMNPESIRKIGAQVEKAIKESSSSSFSTNSEELRIPSNSPILASEWVELLKLTLKYIDYKNAANQKAREVANIQRELEGLQTPMERRKILEEKLKELQPQD